MNEDKKLKREKKKDKKIKKSFDNKNKASKTKQILMDVMSLVDLPMESTTTFKRPNSASVKKSEDNENSDADADDDDDDANKQITDLSEIEILDSLTGIPHHEDEILFAIPVVAPYSALTNYK